MRINGWARSVFEAGPTKFVTKLRIYNLVFLISVSLCFVLHMKVNAYARSFFVVDSPNL